MAVNRRDGARHPAEREFHEKLMNRYYVGVTFRLPILPLSLHVQGEFPRGPKGAERPFDGRFDLPSAWVRGQACNL